MDDSQRFCKQQILDYSKLKEIADDNFKFDEMVQSFLKMLREKEKLPNQFSKVLLQTQKQGLVLEIVTQRTHVSYTLDWKIMQKVENSMIYVPLSSIFWPFINKSHHQVPVDFFVSRGFQY